MKIEEVNSKLDRIAAQAGSHHRMVQDYNDLPNGSILLTQTDVNETLMMAEILLQAAPASKVLYSMPVDAGSGDDVELFVRAAEIYGSE